MLTISNQVGEVIPWNYKGDNFYEVNDLTDGVTGNLVINPSAITGKLVDLMTGKDVAGSTKTLVAYASGCFRVKVATTDVSLVLGRTYREEIAVTTTDGTQVFAKLRRVEPVYLTS